MFTNKVYSREPCVFSVFLTMVDYTIHIVLILVSTFLTLWINRDKSKVSFYKRVFYICSGQTCSICSHISMEKKAVFPPVFGLIHRGLWIPVIRDSRICWKKEFINFPKPRNYWDFMCFPQFVLIYYSPIFASR